MTSPVAQQDRIVLNTPVKAQMTLTFSQTARSDPISDGVDWSTASRVPSSSWTADISSPQTSEQKFPPTDIFGVDTRQILHTWEEIVDISEAIAPVRTTADASFFNDKA